MLKFKKTHLLSGLFLLLLNSCSKELKKETPSRDFGLYYQHEARWADIPLILDFVPTCYQDKGTSLVIKGTSNVPIKECYDFYKDEMERLGWKLLVYFDTEKKIIVETPYKICLIELSEIQKKKRSITVISLYCSAKNRSRS